MQQPILCIRTDKIFAKGKWQGLQRNNLDYFFNLLTNDSEFRIREELEHDPKHKQIIPQVILRNNNKYFLHKQIDANEKRLNELCPLPLGGHVEEFDQINGTNIIQNALERELTEEAEINTNIVTREFIGLIYIEDENLVNCVHLGLLYTFDLEAQDVQMKEPGLKSIGWVDEKYLCKNINTLTYWSRIFVDQYLNNNI